METNQRDVATRVVAELKRHGHIAVFAGGCVRDEILGLEPSDYDVATSALPDQVESIFERTLPGAKLSVSSSSSSTVRPSKSLPCERTDSTATAEGPTPCVSSPLSRKTPGGANSP